MEYTIATQVETDFETTIDKVEEELEEQGFGVLTDIDVQKTLNKKLGEDYRKYRILGACNPDFAHKAMEKETAIGALLPCNVIVYEDTGKVFVEALDPETIVSATGNEELQQIAEKVRPRLVEAVNNL